MKTRFLFPPTRMDSGGGGQVGEVPHDLADNGLDAVETRSSYGDGWQMVLHREYMYMSRR